MKTKSVIGFLLLLQLTAAYGAAATPGAASGGTIQINGQQLFYRESGQGEPLLLLHYFGGSTQSWEPFLDRLAAHYRVIAVDMPGHGRSTNAADDFSHRRTARDILALLDTLGVRRFKAIGMSSGGMVLLHMATQQPERIEEMVLVGATIYFGESARRLFTMASVESNLLGSYDELLAHHPNGAEQIRTLYRQFHEARWSYDDMNFTGPLLSTIKARTLIVHGDRDEYFPAEIAFEMYRNIPTAELWIIPGGTHIPIYDPDIPFTEVALKFLKASEKRGE